MSGSGIGGDGFLYEILVFRPLAGNAIEIFRILRDVFLQWNSIPPARYLVIVGHHGDSLDTFPTRRAREEVFEAAMDAGKQRNEDLEGGNSTSESRKRTLPVECCKRRGSDFISAHYLTRFEQKDGYLSTESSLATQNPLQESERQPSWRKFWNEKSHAYLVMESWSHKRCSAVGA